jgi:hypothetical protein
MNVSQILSQNDGITTRRMSPEQRKASLAEKRTPWNRVLHLSS